MLQDLVTGWSECVAFLLYLCQGFHGDYCNTDLSNGMPDLPTTDGKGGKEGSSSHRGNAMAGESFGILLLSKRVGLK